jgi:hypothetical protein
MEVLIATAILIIGVSAMAALAAVLLTRGRQSRYINVAETLASEKLEDLSRYDMAAPQICVQSSDTQEGSLTASVISNITCPNSTLSAENIPYYDDVSVDFVTGTDCANANYGCFDETIYDPVSGLYKPTYHAPDGTITNSSTGSSTAPTNMTFHRTWLIESNTPVTGTRRITVLVTVTDQSVKPGVSFQMSTVRQ